METRLYVSNTSLSSFVLFCLTDRKILRFLRGNAYSVDKVCELMTKFLAWRDENGVDEIRESILRGGLNHPKKFPLGDKVHTHTQHTRTVIESTSAVSKHISNMFCLQILSMVPRIVVAPSLTIIYPTTISLSDCQCL
jgi:hypothetical protein